jgi:hypothetical protein
MEYSRVPTQRKERRRKTEKQMESHILKVLNIGTSFWHPISEFEEEGG